jgi:hypothetical protein
MNDSQMAKIARRVAAASSGLNPPRPIDIVVHDNAGSLDAEVNWQHNYSRLYLFIEPRDVDPAASEPAPVEVAEAPTETGSTAKPEPKTPAKPATPTPPTAYVTLHGICGEYRLPIVQRVKVSNGGFIEVPFLSVLGQLKVELDQTYKFTLLGI